MSYIFTALLVIVLIALVVWVFLNSDARAIAQFFKLILPVCLMTIGIIATIAGRGQFGIPAIGMSLLWWYFLIR